MENDPNNANAPATKADLRAEFGKFEEKLDQRLDERFSEQANVILEALGELMEKKLDEKFDPVITKLDGILKGVEALQQENTVGAEQLRRHADQLQKHEARITKLEWNDMVGSNDVGMDRPLQHPRPLSRLTVQNVLPNSVSASPPHTSLTRMSSPLCHRLIPATSFFTSAGSFEEKSDQPARAGRCHWRENLWLDGRVDLERAGGSAFQRNIGVPVVCEVRVNAAS